MFVDAIRGASRHFLCRELHHAVVCSRGEGLRNNPLRVCQRWGCRQCSPIVHPSVWIELAGNDDFDPILLLLLSIYYLKDPEVPIELLVLHATEFLELQAERPTFRVFFIPGNPGVVTYYKEFLEALFENLDGQASVIAISHIAHVSKVVFEPPLLYILLQSASYGELGKSFSLQDQINHKVQFLREILLLQTSDLPLLLVGHSIGAYIALEILKKFPSQVQYVVGLYPFLTLNKHSKFQSVLGKVVASPALCAVISAFADLVGRLPKKFARGLVKVLLGRVWDPLAVDVTCRYMLQKNVVSNFLYMGRTEFVSLSPEPDWDYLQQNRKKISFLFGIDDHWGPLSLLDEMNKKVPELNVTTESEGHLHAFCCTKAGSDWVAHYVADTIFNHTRYGLQ